MRGAKVLLPQIRDHQESWSALKVQGGGEVHKMRVATMEGQRTRVVATQHGPQMALVARHQKQAPRSLRGLLQPEVHNRYRAAVRKGEFCHIVHDDSHNSDRKLEKFLSEL
jgi:hypothetical protein